jgi:putative membrane protein
MNLKLFTILVLIALAAVFIVQNADVVELRFLFWKMAMSRALMFVFLVLIGVAVGWLLRGHMLHKSQHIETKDT